jgi:hypothetical protein
VEYDFTAAMEDELRPHRRRPEVARVDWLNGFLFRARSTAVLRSVIDNMGEIVRSRNIQLDQARRRGHLRVGKVRYYLEGRGSGRRAEATRAA